MAKIFITRKISDAGIEKLKTAGHEVVVSPHDRVLAKEELMDFLKSGKFDAVLCLLTDKIDNAVFESAGKQVKVFANLAVGFDNVDVEAAKKRGIYITNTPEVLSETVAEHTFALILAIAHRIAEADAFTRAGKYKGWEPELLLGRDVSGKTLGVVGLGRIGSRVAYHGVKGFGMKAFYHDVKRNADFEKEYEAVYKEKLEELLAEADFVSLHVPLLPSTRHLINMDRLQKMKRTAYLINTSRGPVVDEAALARALQGGLIAGAAIDVFEEEPKVHPDLLSLQNIILTPHIASATHETRAKMAQCAAKNIIAALAGQEPPNMVKM